MPNRGCANYGHVQNSGSPGMLGEVMRIERQVFVCRSGLSVDLYFDAAFG